MSNTHDNVNNSLTFDSKRVPGSVIVRYQSTPIGAIVVVEDDNNAPVVKKGDRVFISITPNKVKQSDNFLPYTDEYKEKLSVTQPGTYIDVKNQLIDIFKQAGNI